MFFKKEKVLPVLITKRGSATKVTKDKNGILYIESDQPEEVFFKIYPGIDIRDLK